jgi:hypothetical protein
LHVSAYRTLELSVAENLFSAIDRLLSKADRAVEVQRIAAPHFGGNPASLRSTTSE